MYEWGSEKAIISEINENDPTPYISSILQDTCPTGANHTIIIYGQNFQPNTTVSIVGVGNIITDVISPSELSVSFTAGSIAGDFDVVVINDTKSSALWGEIRKIYIIANAGGTLPLLDTWIDCRINGSPDEMIGNIPAMPYMTWARGVFGYSLTSYTANPSVLNNFLLFENYSFFIDFPIKLEMIFYSAAPNNGICLGLSPKSVGINHSTLYGYQFRGGTSNFSHNIQNAFTPNFFTYSRIILVSTPANTYYKIVMTTSYLHLFNVNIADFTSGTKIGESDNSMLKQNLANSFKNNGYSQIMPGVQVNTSMAGLANSMHLTAFKLSWA